MSEEGVRATSERHSRVGVMKLVLSVGVVVAVVVAISRFRQRGDADVWHAVTTR